MAVHQRTPAELAQENASLRARLADAERQLAGYTWDHSGQPQLSAAGFRHILDTLMVGVMLVGADGSCRFANRQAAAMFGLTPVAMLGKSLGDLLTPDEAQLCMERNRELIASQAYAEYERTITTPTGERTFLMHDQALVDAQGAGYALLSSSIDITEYKRVADDLRITLTKYRTLFDSFPLGITVSDRAGQIVEANPTAEHLLGLGGAEQSLRQIDGAEWRIMRPDGSPMPAEEYASVRALKERRSIENIEMGIITPAGKTTWLNVTAAPLPLESYGVVITYGDITARRQAEAAIRQLNETLEQRIAERTEDLLQANAALARATRLKDEFLANVSHELRTPLSAVLGRAELLSEGIYGPLNPHQAEAMRSINASGQHLLALIDEILDLERVETGRLVLRYTAVDVAQICQRGIHMVARAAAQKRISLSVSLDTQVKTLYADERRLLQILINLLSNAVKFTGAGGAVGLEVHGASGRRGITFTIWDSGIGIAESDIPRLFDPFTQVEGGLNRRHEGSGLGLALTQRLAQAHHGRIDVTSSLGHGSRFSVTLPWNMPSPTPEAAAPDADATPPIVAQTAPTASDAGPPAVAAGDGASILLVEDSVDQIQVMLDYLKTQGYRVSVAQNGGDALLLARTSPPALVLMDIQLPGIDGLETMRRMRLDSRLRAVPFIALTALALPGDRERCLAAGASDYLAKPVRLPVLLAAIRSLLATTSVREAARAV